MKKPSEYNGIVVVDKPAGITSHDVVDAARRLFRTKRVGHTGTLDPDATGVLILCLGYATRLAEFLSASRKNYAAEFVFGVETDTQDASGQILAESDASHLTPEMLRSLLPRFSGMIQQIPPMVSAVHHQGRRLYELAREGVTVERAPRDVQIDRLELLGFTPGTHPMARLEITCSTGTYIRTLAADMGTAAETGGMMQTLRRTWVGEPGHAFTLEDAHTLDVLRERGTAGTLSETVLPLAAALSGWTQITLEETDLTRIRSGQGIPVPNRFHELRSQSGMKMDCSPFLGEGAHFQDSLPKTALQDMGERIALLDTEGAVCAIARLADGTIQPTKVLF